MKLKTNADYLEYIENNLISCDCGYRGGSIKVDVSELFPEIEDEEPVIGAYQNYLGGGMLGAVVGASQFDINSLTKKHQVIATKLKEECKRYLFNQTNHEGDEWEEQTYQQNQKMAVSAY